MAAYSFDEFCRYAKHSLNLLWPTRVIMSLSWDESSSRAAEFFRSEDFTREIADTMRILNAVNTAMTPAERANPRAMSEFRRLDLADAANLTDVELSAVFHYYEAAAKRSQGWKQQWWQDTILLGALWFSIPFYATWAAGRFIVQKLRLHKKSG